MSFPRYTKYKDSGVEWLSEVPEHWESSRIRWLCSRFSGGTPDKSKVEYWENGSIPWLNSGAVNDRVITEPSEWITPAALEKSSAKWIPREALLIALAGQGKTKGMVAQLKFEATCNQSMAALIPSHQIKPRFLFWWLDSNYQNIRNMAGGDLRDGLNLELLGDIPCPLPSLVEQQEIAAFLDRETAKIDALIAEQQRLIELLQEKRQAVISHAVTKGLNPDAPMKDSGIEWLGEVPAHWEVLPLKRLGTIRYGIGEPPKYHDDGTPLIRATNVRSGVLTPVGLVFVNPDEIPAQRIVWLDAGDIIVVRSGAGTGDSAIIPNDYGPAIAGFDMVLHLEKANAWFIQFVLLSSYVKYGQIYVEKMRAAQPHLNAEELGNCDIVLPPDGEQTAIVHYLSNQTHRFDTLQAEAERAIELLQERRTALISAAVTGQIDVRGLVPKEAG